MLQQSSSFPIDKPVADVLRLLSTKPTTWLRAFLQLAAHDSVGREAIRAAQTPWFRLSPPLETSPGLFACKLIWRPRVNGVVFEKFQGDLCLAEGQPASTLWLVGVWTGGTDVRNAALLDRLLLLISNAISSGQDFGG